MLKLTNVFPIFVIAIILFMFGCEQVNSPNHESGTDIATADGSIAEAHAGSGIVYVDASNNSGNEDGTQVNPFDTIQEGVDHANDNDVVLLQSDFTLGSQVTISSPLTLDGNGYTVDADFTKTSNSNNSAIGVGSDDVTIQNITVNDIGGGVWASGNAKQLHGINIYTSTGVVLDNVTATNFGGSGILVNGSTVTASDITTGGNAWHGINVDQGGSVTQPAVLNISNTSSHDENSPATASEFVDGESIPDIFIDDATDGTDATVNDLDDQYVSFEVEFRDGVAKVFTHYNSLSKDDCKKGGYANYGFKNQGKCIQFVNTGKK